MKASPDTSLKKQIPSSNTITRIFATVSFSLLCVAIVCTADAALTANLVALYDLDESTGLDAADSIGGNNGTLNGNFTGAEWTTGKLGGGLEFTRTNLAGSYASGTNGGFIEADTLLKNVNATTGVLENGGEYTFSAWVKWQQAASGGSLYGYSLWGANTAVGANSNMLRAGIDNDGIDYYVAGGSLGSTGVAADFSDNDWHLATVLIETNGQATYYFDGQESRSLTSFLGGTWDAGNLFHFGMEMEANQNTDNFSGTLDQLAIWDRKLTTQEISDLYNNGAGVSLNVAVPEPSSTALLGLGGLALLLRRRR